jgi:hypothetical protein
MKRIHRALASGMLLMPAIAPAQGHAHQHGTLALDIGVDKAAVTIQITTPLDNLTGFEHAPRSDEERGRVAAMLDKLRAAQALFAIDPAAQCRLAGVDIASAVLGLGVPPSAGAKDEHADLAATFDFRCNDAGKAAYVDVRLLDAFAGLKRIDVQVAGPHGQFKRHLSRAERRVALMR